MATASEERSAGSIVLSVVNTPEPVTVPAVQVQTASVENSALISHDPISNPIAHRHDPITPMRVPSGVTGASDNDAANGSFGAATPTVSGIRSGLNTVTLKGQNSTNADVTNAFSSVVSPDDVEEVEGLTNGYQAEYERNAGASSNLVSKRWHARLPRDAYYFCRNANNNGFNNRRGLARPLYRYITFGGTIGGRLYISQKFNK